MSIGFVSLVADVEDKGEVVDDNEDDVGFEVVAVGALRDTETDDEVESLLPLL